MVTGQRGHSTSAATLHNLPMCPLHSPSARPKVNLQCPLLKLEPDRPPPTTIHRERAAFRAPLLRRVGTWARRCLLLPNQLQRTPLSSRCRSSDPRTFTREWKRQRTRSVAHPTLHVRTLTRRRGGRCTTALHGMLRAVHRALPGYRPALALSRRGRCLLVLRTPITQRPHLPSQGTVSQASPLMIQSLRAQ